MSRPTIRTLIPDDAGTLERFLAPRWESSMFLLDDLARAGLADPGEASRGSYSAAFVDGAMTGVVARYRDGTMAMQAPRHAAALAGHAARASGGAVAGLLGPDEQVTAAAAALGFTAGYDSRQRLYTLDLASLALPSALAGARVRARRADAGDASTLVDWRVAHMCETMGYTESPALRVQVRAGIERALGRGRLWLLEAEEEGWRPVSRSDFNAVAGPAVQVGGVWTPPRLRRRGYARAVVAASLRAARDVGATEAVLFTPLANEAAQRAYRALGFRPRGLYRILRT